MKNPPLKMSCVKAAFFSLLIPLFLAGSARGAVVTWNAAAVNVDTSQAASQISTAGTLFAAVNIWSFYSGVSKTVNGVTFTASDPHVSIGKSNQASGYGSAPGTGTYDYAYILDAGAYITPLSQSPSNPIVVSGLAVGHTYQLQIWTPYWNTNWVTRYSDLAPTSASGYTHATGESPSVNTGFTGASQYIVGTFVADASGTQNIYYFGNSTAAMFGAMQVRDLGIVTSSGLTMMGANISTGSGTDGYNAATDSFIVMGAGGGFQINNSNPDADHFTYTTWPAGDVEIVARLESFDGPTNAEAGIMIRQSNSSSVNRAATWFWKDNTAQGNLAFDSHGPLWAGRDYYYSMGGWANKPQVTLPYWLKLVRVGQNFAAYWSLNGCEWNLISNTSGGALMGTGTFNVGFFVASGSTSPATAIFSHLYIGAPRMKYQTSWVGASSGGMADGYPSSSISALWVKSGGTYDGTCYANSSWDEAGQCAKAYKDGKVAFSVELPQSGMVEGSVTGNTNNLFLGYYDPAHNVTGVCQTDFNGTLASRVWVAFPTPTPFPSPAPSATPTPIPLKVGGLAASDTVLFVSETLTNTVRIVDLTANPPRQTAVANTAGVIAHPGPIAYDLANNCFWITDCGSDFPLTDHVSTQSGYTPSIKCFSPAGVYQNRQITGVSNPTALAKDPTSGRLYVCDNGPDQNIKYYTGLGGSGNPAYAGAFGQTGGLWQPSASGTPVPGSHPGQIYDSAFGGDQRFYGPTGVGFDSGGNIYVACNGTASGGTDLRKFNSSGAMIWRQLGLEGMACGDFDPATGDVYTTKERFTMNYANTAPGSEWSYTAFTRNPFLANDARNPGGFGAIGVQVRRLAGNNVFMYTDTKDGPPCMFYRFNNQDGSSGPPATPGSQGTTAIPFGSIVSAAGGFKLWIDANADGLKASDGSEEPTITCPLGAYRSFDVDSNGDIWLALPGSSIFQLKCSGSQTIGSPAVATVPAYSATSYQTYCCPAPIQDLGTIKYDRAHDVMYCLGKDSNGKWMLARYDNWRTSSTPDDHPPRYVTPLPDFTADFTLLGYHPAPSNSYDNYEGMGFAGDKVFIADLWGPIRVYDANMGNPVITLNAGPEGSASTAWEDTQMGVNAFQRSNGEYLVQEGDDGLHGNILLYRWTPTADTTVPGTPTQLTATAQGHAIALSWIGPVGTPTSYNIYRWTTGGSPTLYQSNVATASFVDANVTLGTTYYYTVAAVSSVGTGTQSNQASAAPAGAQAEFVKYDTATLGNWNPSGGPKVYGSEGYDIPGQTASLPSSYVNSLTHVQTGVASYTNPDPMPPTDPNFDVKFLQMPSGSNRTSAIYTNVNGLNQQWHEIRFSASDVASGNWHQVSIYLLAWNYHPQFDTVEVVDLITGTVLDTRQPMDYHGGKWLVWNVRGNVKIRLTKGWSFPVLSGIFFDQVQTPPPALGWWKLDETGTATIAADSSGAGNNAGKNGGTWTAGAHSGPGGFAGCLTCAGTNATSNVALWAFNPPNAPKLTYSMWFKTSTSGVLLGMNAPGNPPPAFAPVLYVGTDNKLHGAFYTGVIQNMQSTTSVNDNQWHHATLTCDGSLQTLYLDGEIVGMLSAPTSPLNINSAWYYFEAAQGFVTGWPSTTGTFAYFNGQIDDMRLYDRILPSSEVWKLYHP